MRNLLLLMCIAVMLDACKTPKSPGTGSEGTAYPSWSLTEVWRTDTVLRTCESVLYDGGRNVLFVSCINGTSSEKNGQGYIALLGPDGSVKTLHWITGLDAPKGMGVDGNLLYVTDIDRLVIIDIEKAGVMEKIVVEGASFLNDVAVDTDGTVYFSDSDQGTVWTFRNGELKQWISEGLDRPNGLYVEKDRILLTSSGSSDLKVIDESDGTFETVTTGIGQGDGVEFTGDKGYYIVSSWAGEIFLVYPDYSKVSLLKTPDEEINSADIGLNRESKTVYVPTFYDNRVVAYSLDKN
jgi:hypothetical protein